MDALARLEEVGFQKVGHWVMDSGAPVVIVEESHAAAVDVLYAFVSARTVLYVGKTQKALHKRMYGYQHPGPSQRTNLACNARIRDCLATGHTLDLYVRRADRTSQIGGFVVSQAAALEDAIIQKLQPPWNRQSKRGRSF